MANPRRSGSLEFVRSQRRDQFVNLKRRRDHDMANTHSQKAPSIYTDHTSQHHASHDSHNEGVYNLRRKVYHLRQRLHRKAWIREEIIPTPSQSSSSEDNWSYRWRSRTPPSESFTSSTHLTSGERHYHKRSRTPPWRNIGNDAMGKALL